MNEFQKVIKYVAIAFGIFLAFSIISSIAGAIFGIANVGLYLEGKQEIQETEVEFSETFEDIRKLEIEIAFSNLKIVEGSEWKVEGSNLNSSFKARKQGEILRIQEEKSGFWGMNKTASYLTVTIPKDTILEKAEIKVGAGNAQIEAVLTERLTLELGAGNVDIAKLETKRANIKGGAGRVSIQKADIQDLNLEAGVGKVEFSGRLTGRSEINGGIGKIELNLKGDKKEYQFDIETGLGSITINGQKCANERIYGEGESKIKVEGGIGAVEINLNNF